MVELAAERHASIANSEFRHCSVERIDFSAASFDAVWSMQTVQYLDEPLNAIRELARVTRPGGRLILIEGGLAGVDLPEGDLTRYVFGPRAGIGLRLPGLREAGLRRLLVQPAFGVALGHPDPKVIEYARSQSAAAAAQGVAGDAEAERWLADVESRAADRRWFSIDCMLVVAGTVPLS